VTTIKASCPSCGEVELTSGDISLRVCSHGPLSYYTFTCPECDESVRKPADDHIVSLLMSGGVRAEVWEVPAEVLEPKPGPDLDYDDLLDFVLQLGRDDMLAARATAPAHR
jgi:rRNA maturation protein Nop10